MEEQRMKEREAIRRKKELEELRKKMKQEEDEQKATTANGREFVDEDGTIVIEGKVLDNNKEEEDGVEEVFDGTFEDDPEELFEKEVIDGGEKSSNMSMNPRLSDLDYEPKKEDFEDDSDEISTDPRLIPSDQELLKTDDVNDPEFTEETKSVPVPEDQPEQVLIKRQSKDETTETLVVTANKEKRVTDNVVEAITGMLNKLLPTARKEFDYDEFNETVMKANQYVLHERWYKDHFVMSCPAQGFLERFSLQAEFFDRY